MQGQNKTLSSASHAVMQKKLKLQAAPLKELESVVTQLNCHPGAQAWWWFYCGLTWLKITSV